MSFPFNTSCKEAGEPHITTCGYHRLIPPTLLSSTSSLPLFRFFPTVFSHIFWGVLRRFQHCTGHITTGSWKGRENKYIQLVKVLYCKLLTNSKQLPGFPLEAMPGTEPRPQSCEARVLPLCHCAPPLPTVFSLLSSFSMLKTYGSNTCHSGSLISWSGFVGYNGWMTSALAGDDK